jgi:protein SCO1
MNEGLIMACGVYCSRILFFVAAAVSTAQASTNNESSPLASVQSRLLSQVTFQQRLDNQTSITAKFKNEHGRDVTLQDCIEGRPTVLVLAYYRCPMLCNQVLNGVARTLRGVGFRPGQQISVVVVSFDPTDTPELAAKKKSALVEAYNRGDSGAGWHFLTGEEHTVKELADSVGFHYVYDENTKQFAHASGIVLLTPTGRVSRYFYGIDYPTRDVRLGLIEASAGHIGSAVDELLLLCFHYDPLTGRYGLVIMRLIQVVSIGFVLALILYICISLRREFKKQRPLLSPDVFVDGT